jgi:outer membrane murein-binding lipoprotein Lpp
MTICKHCNGDIDMTPLIIGGAATMLIGNILGGVMKMFGDNEKTPQKLAEEMMAGAVRGILEHFEWKMDELKRDIDNKNEKIQKLEDKVEEFEEKEKAAIWERQKRDEADKAGKQNK